MIALEGERNEKLSWHPSGRFRRCRLLAYKIHHHPIFYTLCLLDTLALMGLAVQEAPTTTNTPLTDELRAVRSITACCMDVILWLLFSNCHFNLPSLHNEHMHVQCIYIQRCASMLLLHVPHTRSSFSEVLQIPLFKQWVVETCVIVRYELVPALVLYKLGNIMCA